MGKTDSKKRNTIQQSTVPCDLGWLIAAATDAGLCYMAFGDTPDALLSDMEKRFPESVFTPAQEKLTANMEELVNLANGQTDHCTMDLDIKGTSFQQKVWKGLTEIPSGTTLSYSELAERIGKPGSVRAVANACGANPVALVIPCHRVIRRDGSPGGYRWGIERKKTLLEREK